MAVKTYKEFIFDVNLAPDDDPKSYAPGFPYIIAYAENLEKAREEAEMDLDDGETLGDLRES